MKYHEYWRTIALFISICACIGISYIYFSYKPPEVLRIDALDIGQGDATLLTFHNGTQLLIDTGPTDKVVKELSEVLPWLDRKIDAVLLTHEDKDHIGGLLATLAAYTVDTVLHNGQRRTTSTAKQNYAAIETLTNHALTKGDQIHIAGHTITVLWPDRVALPEDEPNMFSLVLSMKLGNHTLVFMGDAPHAVELEVMKDIQGPVSVLKAGHHGSRTSSLQKFINQLKPKITLISSAKGNRYGHPHKEVLEALKDSDIRQTALSGRLTVFCNLSGCI